MNKFWNWKQAENNQERTLFIHGAIASESWYDDEVTPQIFRNELLSGNGNITLWINSPGGCCIAAAQIYNMLMEYQGDVTVKIDGIAASAASVIAMAGTKVLMSPVSMLMIHNPSTMAWGESGDMKRAISMLDEVKESIINAYEIKTSIPRKELSNLMDNETWMNVHSAMEKGFVDGILEGRNTENTGFPQVSDTYKKVEVTNSFMEKVAKKCVIPPQPTPTAEEPETPKGRSVSALYERLDLIKKHI